MQVVHNYGRRIRETRKSRCWTQEQLARAAELDIRTIQRVEKDETQGLETLQAIAGAFDVDLSALKETRRFAESRLVRATFVDDYDAFVAADEQHVFHMAVSHICAPLSSESRNEVEDLVHQVLADRECISYTDHDLRRLYVQNIRQPLKDLFARQLVFYFVDEQRDLLLPTIEHLPAPTVNHIADWRVRHFLLVPRHGCFPAPGGALHRFDRQCQAAGDAIFRALRDRGGASGFPIFANAIAPVAAAQDENCITWCETCFPLDGTGSRIGIDYIAQVTGLTNIQLTAMMESADDLDVGHA